MRILAGLICWAALVLSTRGETVICPEQRIALFNGKNLDGFYTWLLKTRYEDPRRVFSVTNGWIRISGEDFGCLSTTEAYGDYHLLLEFKWGDVNAGDRIGKARDSGLFLHSIGPDGNSHDGNGAFRAAVECNIFEGSTGDLLLIRGTDSDGKLIAPRLSAETAVERDEDGWPYWQAGGAQRTLERWGRLNWFGKDRAWRDRFGFRGSDDVERRPGEWNRLECICEGGRITVRLNGTIVNQAFDLFPKSGRILLQSEGSEIYFRKLELKPVNGAIGERP